MGNLFVGLVIPKNGDRITFQSVHGWHLTTTDGRNLTQTQEVREGSHFAVEYNGADKICLKAVTGKYLTLKGKEGFEFSEKPEDNSYFTPCYQNNKMALKGYNEFYLSAKNNFETEQREIPTEESWFHITHVASSVI